MGAQNINPESKFNLKSSELSVVFSFNSIKLLHLGRLKQVLFFFLIIGFLIVIIHEQHVIIGIN